jgi:hypothetical protein
LPGAFTSLKVGGCDAVELDVEQPATATVMVATAAAKTAMARARRFLLLSIIA